jgi:hypothetical protein
VRRDCEEPLSTLACGRAEAPTVVLPDAEPGIYYVWVDGVQLSLLSRGGPIEPPPDAQNFVARDDLNGDCWSDGGSDAFDCYGRIQVAHGGQSSANLQSAPGARQGAAGAYAFRYTSDLAHTNVWRVRLEPAEAGDPRPVTITVTGNLGSDGATVSEVRQRPFDGIPIPYLTTTDSFAAPRDPPVVHLLVPSDPDHLGQVDYAVDRDNVTITATDITLPAVFYVAPRYADSAAVADALIADLGRGGAVGGEAAFGAFELTIEAE